MELLMVVLCIGIVLLCFKIYESGVFQGHKIIGDKGESIVANKLKLLDDEYKVENNVHLGKTQIDHLVIHHAAKIIFVIETKMWGGIITGDIEDKKWKQEKNSEMRYYNNPLAQNKYHCSIVRKYYRGYKVYSVVVFVGNKNVPKSRCIIGQDELLNYIRKTTNKVYSRGIIDLQTDWSSIWLKH